MTGYFSSAPQVIAVAKQIKALKAEHEGLQVLVDPVIGDHGRLYVGKDVAETIRDQLLPLATITTPNLFELLWLAGGEDVKNAVATLGVKETIVTSIPENTSHLRTELHTSTVQSHRTEKRQGVPNGTGDFLAGCYLAERLRHPATEAFELAMTRLEQAIARSIGSPALKLS
jgi:pyridoxine kinase